MRSGLLAAANCAASLKVNVAASSLGCPSVARWWVGRREAGERRRDRARTWPPRTNDAAICSPRRGIRQCRPNCLSALGEGRMSIAGDVRPVGRKDAREPRGSDTPEGCSVASALWCPGETENQLAVSAR